jgi:hypothetical protein
VLNILYKQQQVSQQQQGSSNSWKANNRRSSNNSGDDKNTAGTSATAELPAAVIGRQLLWREASNNRTPATVGKQATKGTIATVGAPAIRRRDASNNMEARNRRDASNISARFAIVLHASKLYGFQKQWRKWQ